ncbi:hypothetical protein RchiOBHm_Chr4g0405581 [Rosa chinensis]|uniref:Uncharacterized protein n=1 Tax=Rosa chinensis TaxID=74649 RepID=A0A2P6QU46_ROSCH|nr:hypothetical protein RchiOBHm_Chr4g0405581 [Rosa chinensis]
MFVKSFNCSSSSVSSMVSAPQNLLVASLSDRSMSRNSSSIFIGLFIFFYPLHYHH